MQEKKPVSGNERGRGGGSFQERRRQADWVINAATVLSVISWLVAFFVLTVIQMAAPERRNFLSEVNIGAAARTTWDATLLPFAFGLLVLSVLASIAAFIFNAMRMRRKTDRYRKSILIIGALNIIGLFAFSYIMFF
ncbi:MAG: hypothetical protein FWE27_01170 [Defluviitaleaceae bacterium]|nr:hypothetical protein [Defluviitaleaceae bacterium]